MVIDAEVLRGRAAANAAVTHRRDPRRDLLVDRRLDRLGELSLNQNLGNGAKPLRSRPPDPGEQQPPRAARQNNDAGAELATTQRESHRWSAGV